MTSMSLSPAQWAQWVSCIALFPAVGLPDIAVSAAALLVQVSIMGIMPETLVLWVLPLIVFGDLVDFVFQLRYKFKDR